MSKSENGSTSSCCKLCLTENTEPISYEDPVALAVLKERILTHLSIEIKQSNQSELVCEECSKRVNSWCEFKRSCQRNQSSIEFLTNESPEKAIIQVKGESITEECADEDDDIEIITENIDIKAESIDFDSNDVAAIDYTVDQSNADEQICNVALIMQETEEPETQNGIELASTEKEKFQLSIHSEKKEYEATPKFVKNDSTQNEMGHLSALETSYLEKCRAMVEMYRSLNCACHLASHPTLKGLLSHLRSVKKWFPVFTCYHCMITFTDRSSSGKHLHKCTNGNLEALMKLANLKSRSLLKTRIYQNYRCMECRFICSFHEDFCKHIDEEHSEEKTRYICSCQKNFDSLQDYKDHMYFSCMVEYFCDICSVAVRTLNEFVNHARIQHDSSEGFSLLQEDNYKKRSSPKVATKQNKEVLGKRNSCTFIKTEVIDLTEEVDEITPKRQKSSRNSPTKCPKCIKVYSSQANMLRHLRTHQDEVKQENRKTGATDNSYYRCPDCQIMFNAGEWETHKKSHEKVKCSDCDKVFVFQTELELHKNVHLNLKVYSLNRTDSSSMLSQTSSLLVCDICNILCENFEDLESHKLSHEDDDVDISKYLCATCNLNFVSYSEYNEHNLKLHADKQLSLSIYPRKCDECEKVVTSGSAFASHKAMHRRLRDDKVKILKGDPPLEIQKSRNFNTQDLSTASKHSKSSKKFFNRSRNNNADSGENSSAHINQISEREELSGESNNILMCEICIQTFFNESSFKQHKAKYHVQKSVKNVNKMANDLKFKMIEDTPISSKVKKPENVHFSCKTCNKKFISQSAMYAHQGWHRKMMNYGHSTSKEPNWQPKVKREEFECEICGLDLPNDIALQIHTIEKHGNFPNLSIPKCNSCNQEFGSQTEFENHIQLHEIVEKQSMPEKSYECKNCFAPYSNKEALQAHLKLCHEKSTQEFECSQCGRNFGKLAALNTHMKVHEKYKVVAGNLKFLVHCSICNMGFNTTKDLRIHTISAHPF